MFGRFKYSKVAIMHELKLLQTCEQLWAVCRKHFADVNETSQIHLFFFLGIFIGFVIELDNGFDGFGLCYD